MKHYIILLILTTVISLTAQTDSVRTDTIATSVAQIDSALPAPTDSVGASADTIAAAKTDSSLEVKASTDSVSAQNVLPVAPTNSVQLEPMDVSVERQVKPGLLIPATGDPVRVMSSYSDTVGVQVEAGDTIAYYGELGDSYIIVENEPFAFDDTVETLGLMPKYLVRVIAYPETVIVNPTIPVELPVAAVAPVVPLTFKDKVIYYKDKAIRYVKENKKPVAIGGGAVGGLIILVAVLAGGDDAGSGSSGGGGGTEDKMIDPPNIKDPDGN